MLKNKEHKLRLALLKLFNFILSVGYFPDTWNRGLISPTFKSGSKFDPKNCRCICVRSNLGKLFCSITKKSLILSSNMPRVYLDKYINQSICMLVDFQTDVDSVWHQGLLSKLSEIGIEAKRHKTMYSINKCEFKIGNKQTELFTGCKAGNWQHYQNNQQHLASHCMTHGTIKLLL